MYWELKTFYFVCLFDTHFDEIFTDRQLMLQDFSDLHYLFRKKCLLVQTHHVDEVGRGQLYVSKKLFLGIR